MVDEQKIKSFISVKNIVVDVKTGYIRFNHEIGNDNTWQEIEVDNKSEEEIATIINTSVSKAREGSINQIKE